MPQAMAKVVENAERVRGSLKQGPKKRRRPPITLSLATPDKLAAYRTAAAAAGLSLSGWLEQAADAWIAASGPAPK